ncbi:MAG: exodeoxyribonuclease VII small subunit [Pseudomonadales bacterium]
MPAAKKKTTKDPAATGDPAIELDFEAALAELEEVVAEMEGGELSLDASLAAFERGIRLTRHCQQALKTAELRVQTLTADGTLADLELDELDDS